MRINQKKVEKAVQVITQLGITELPKEMKGDISSFGASIIQSGILPTALFFSEGEYAQAEVEKLKENGKKDEDSSTKLRRSILMKIVFDTLEVAGAYSEKRPLLDYIIKHRSTNPHLLDDITEAAIAVKIAMRAFKFTEN
jgi:CRISPR-associated protein Cmr5